jgi:hypothetical protein
VVWGYGGQGQLGYRVPEGGDAGSQLRPFELTIPEHVYAQARQALSEARAAGWVPPARPVTPVIGAAVGYAGGSIATADVPHAALLAAVIGPDAAKALATGAPHSLPPLQAQAAPAAALGAQQAVAAAAALGAVQVGAASAAAAEAAGASAPAGSARRPRTRSNSLALATAGSGLAQAQGPVHGASNPAAVAAAGAAVGPHTTEPQSLLAALLRGGSAAAAAAPAPPAAAAAPPAAAEQQQQQLTAQQSAYEAFVALVASQPHVAGQAGSEASLQSLRMQLGLPGNVGAPASGIAVGAGTGTGSSGSSVSGADGGAAEGTDATASGAASDYEAAAAADYELGKRPRGRPRKVPLPPGVAPPPPRPRRPRPPPLVAPDGNLVARPRGRPRKNADEALAAAFVYAAKKAGAIDGSRTFQTSAELLQAAHQLQASGHAAHAFIPPPGEDSAAARRARGRRGAALPSAGGVGMGLGLPGMGGGAGAAGLAGYGAAGAGGSGVSEYGQMASAMATATMLQEAVQACLAQGLDYTAMLASVQAAADAGIDPAVAVAAFGISVGQPAAAGALQAPLLPPQPAARARAAPAAAAAPALSSQLPDPYAPLITGVYAVGFSTFACIRAPVYLPPSHPIAAGVTGPAAGKGLLTFEERLFACGLNSYGQLGLGDCDNRYALTEVTALKPHMDAAPLPAPAYLPVPLGSTPPLAPQQQLPSHSVDPFAAFAGAASGAPAAAPFGAVRGASSASASVSLVCYEPPQRDRVISMVGGNQHALLLLASGRVAAMGRGDSGQLGLSEDAHASVPVAASAFHPTLIPAHRFTSALPHAAAATSAGSAPAPVPVPVAVAQIAANSCTSAAVTVDGGVYVWGFGENGQIGAPKARDENLPFQLLPGGGGAMAAAPQLVGSGAGAGAAADGAAVASTTVAGVKRPRKGAGGKGGAPVPAGGEMLGARALSVGVGGQHCVALAVGGEFAARLLPQLAAASAPAAAAAAGGKAALGSQRAFASTYEVIEDPVPAEISDDEDEGAGGDGGGSSDGGSSKGGSGSDDEGEEGSEGEEEEGGGAMDEQEAEEDEEEDVEAAGVAALTAKATSKETAAAPAAVSKAAKGAAPAAKRRRVGEK